MANTESTAQRTPEEQKKYLSDMMFTKHLSITWRVFAITGGSVAIMGLMGYLLDQMLHTHRLFVFAGVMLAFVVAQILNFVVFTRMTNNHFSSTSNL